MARTKTELLITQSLLDRLTGYEDWPATRSASLRMLREGIKRDVEWLLNTRKPHIDGIDLYPLTAKSVFNFGLPDLLTFRGTANDASGAGMAIRQTLLTFEPRIREPHVSLTRAEVLSRSLRFRVDGRLMIENCDEEISFDTILELTSDKYEVK